MRKRQILPSPLEFASGFDPGALYVRAAKEYKLILVTPRPELYQHYKDVREGKVKVLTPKELMMKINRGVEEVPLI